MAHRSVSIASAFVSSFLLDLTRLAGDGSMSYVVIVRKLVLGASQDHSSFQDIFRSATNSCHLRHCSSFKSFGTDNAITICNQICPNELNSTGTSLCSIKKIWTLLDPPHSSFARPISSASKTFLKRLLCRLHTHIQTIYIRKQSETSRCLY